MLACASRSVCPQNLQCTLPISLTLPLRFQYRRDSKRVPHLRWTVSNGFFINLGLVLIVSAPASYTASAQLCPLKYKPIVGWTVGWLNILGTSSTKMILTRVASLTASLCVMRPVFAPRFDV